MEFIIILLIFAIPSIIISIVSSIQKKREESARDKAVRDVLLETSLDLSNEGKALDTKMNGAGFQDWKETISQKKAWYDKDVFDRFIETLECPECHEGSLVERLGKYGKFLACTKYPECKYTKNLDQHKKKVHQKLHDEITSKMKKAYL